MSKVSLAFFATAAVFVLLGMSLGIWMGASHDHSLTPVHAHLNLVGWATMGIMGGFYAMAGDRAPGRIAWLNYLSSAAAAALMAPSLAMLLKQDMRSLPFLMAAQVFAVLGVLLFLVSVVTVWRRSARPVAA